MPEIRKLERLLVLSIEKVFRAAQHGDSDCGLDCGLQQVIHVSALTTWQDFNVCDLTTIFNRL